MNHSSATLFAVLVVALVVSGTFSLIETAMLTFNRSRMKHLQEKGKADAKLLLDMMRRVDKLLSTILLCNNLANVVVATVATVLAVRWLGDEEHVIAVTSFVVTALILVFSEITPKALGVRHAERASLLVARPLFWLLRLLTPIVAVVELIVKALLKLTGNDAHTPYQGSLFGLAELRSVVKDTENLGEAGAAQRNMLVNVIDIKDMSVEDIMVPMRDIFAVNIDDQQQTIVDKLRRTQFTKVPVYKNTPDNIVGVISVQDVLSHAQDGVHGGRSILEQRKRPALFVPARAGILSLLGVFKEQRHKIGVVVSEYGRAIGLVTTSDLLTEIAGQEYHSIPTHSHSVYRKDAHGNVVASGGAQIREINRRLGLALPTDGPKTLNGLVHEQLEEIPDTPSCIQIDGVRMELRPRGKSDLEVTILPPAQQTGGEEQDSEVGG